MPKRLEHFISFDDVPDYKQLLELAFKIKKAPYDFKDRGENKTIGLVFLNPSLRTRLSSVKAAHNLGANVWVLNAGTDSWLLETAEGVIMDGDAQEHIDEAIKVMSMYCDILAVRTFPTLVDRERDYSEYTMNKIRSVVSVPLVSLESATLHPLQSFADLITIAELRNERPTLKVVLTWAPHVKAIPQAVPNSFAQWLTKVDWVDLHITHPKGYQLEEQYVKNAKISFDQEEAFDGADIIYAKNWSSYCEYGKVINKDMSWRVDSQKMALTNNAKFMHCLPVRRNVVVTEDILNSKHSIIIEQAENRIYSAQAVFYELLGKDI